MSRDDHEDLCNLVGPYHGPMKPDDCDHPKNKSIGRVFPYERELKTFIDAMRYKLMKNAHKGRWEDLDLKTALKRLKDEVEELEEAIENGNEIEVILESGDVANYAMIVANIAVQKMNGK